MVSTRPKNRFTPMTDSNRRTGTCTGQCQEIIHSPETWDLARKLHISMEKDWNRDFEMIAQKTECFGAEEFVGKFATVDECASRCRQKSSLFVYGRVGTIRCEGLLCTCNCETDSAGGECTQGRQEDEKYDLYRYKQDWSLVAENKECDNSRDEDKGRLSNVRACAEACRPIASMFTFEATNQGYCRCQRAASTTGTCSTRDCPGRTLYSFNQGNQESPTLLTGLSKAEEASRKKAQNNPLHMPRGSRTIKEKCVPRGTVESDNTKTMCVECNARTILPRDRYPRFINEIICDDVDKFCMTFQGSCQQNYIVVDFKVDINRVGIGRRDEWPTYQQLIRNGCHCQVFRGSVFDAFI